MTCIVGLVGKDSVYIGADSASVRGWTIQVTNLPKVFLKGKFIIGYTASFRTGQILQYHLKVLTKKDGTNERYMITVFAEAVRDCLKKYGFAKIDDNEESGGEFLVAFSGSLYYVGADYQVNSYKSGYAAVGSGEAFALGSLFSTSGMESPARVRLALKAASTYSATVISPFHILVQKIDADTR